jgi:hypothetical protein
MRLTVLSLLLAVALVSALSTARRASAAEAVPHGRSIVAAHQQTPQPVPSNNDSRVEVQVGVLCAAVGLVVVVGTCAYFVRRVLGLSGPPPQDAGGHH